MGEVNLVLTSRQRKMLHLEEGTKDDPTQERNDDVSLGYGERNEPHYSEKRRILIRSIDDQSPAPLPTPIEPGGTYARSPSTEPPYLGKRLYPLSRVFVTIGNYKNMTPFPGFLG